MSVRYSYVFVKVLGNVQQKSLSIPFGFVSDIADFNIIKKAVKTHVDNTKSLYQLECLIEKGYRCDDGYMISVTPIVILKEKDLEKLRYTQEDVFDTILEEYD